MQVIFELDDRSYGTNGTLGFKVLKFVGERKCEFDLDFAVFTQQLVCNICKKKLENLGKIS